MASEDDKENQPLNARPRGIIGELLNTLTRSLIFCFSAFAVGTGVSAAVCLYYGVPLVFSLISGFLVLGIAFALMTGGMFS